jgi:hypothetical protein
MRLPVRLAWFRKNPKTEEKVYGEENLCGGRRLRILYPAIGRWPIPFDPVVVLSIYACLPLLIVAYDIRSRRRIHRSAAIAYAMIVAKL